jgi:hypothetical protein
MADAQMQIAVWPQVTSAGAMGRASCHGYAFLNRRLAIPKAERWQPDKSRGPHPVL